MSKKSINHISIIMDGNGRWANMRNMPRAFGHREGIKSIDKIVKACSVRQITQLTLFAFSSENWNRPDYEVRVLLKLFEDSINKYLIDLNKNNVKLNFVGDLSVFSKNLQASVKNAINLTISNTGLKLNFAINYGGKWDIVNSVNKIINEKKFNDKTNVTLEDIEKNLSITDAPDLLIRTGGERRLSNFMLWQHAYTELYFADCLWPDFSEKELDSAIEFYQDRIRKFGSLIEVNSDLKKDA